MLKKTLFATILLSSFSFSAELIDEKFQILAGNIELKNDIIIAKDRVVIFSDTYYLSANKIVYDKKNEVFELFDDVLIIKDNSIQTKSEYAYLNFLTDTAKQNPFFLTDTTTDLWINSNSSNKEKDLIKLENSVISSCDCVDPFWSIKVSKANYDTKDKWLNTYNTRLYLGSIPVFYTPYFGFSTNKQRRSGLLIPTIGYSKDDGLYYAQPIYFAPSINYDLEIIPQIRNQRGYGTYAYFRFADSPYSTLKLQTGGFIENKEYQLEKDLENKKHFGWNIDYLRTKVFSSGDNQDGLFTSINFMNDIEYKTLEKEEENISVDKKIESKINYFYNTPKYYGGLYARYYIDTQADNNDETLQELPQLHFHKYNDNILNGLIYSVDGKFYNYTRNKGLSANIYELNVPLSYTNFFLNDYLYFTLENSTTFSKYNYNNEELINYDNGTLIQNNFIFKFGTDLIKPYEDYLHTLNMNISYLKPKNLKKDGDLYKITNENIDLKSFPTIQNQENIKFSMTQTLYDKEKLSEFINHRISQSILYEDNDPKLQNLENYVRVNYDFGTFSNKTTYNVEDKEFIENDSQLNFNHNNLSFTIGYYNSKDTPNSNKEDLESYYLSSSYKFNEDYTLGYYENFNIKEKVRNKQGFNFNIDDKCWNLDLRYEKEIVPTTSTQLDDNLKQNIVYMQLQLKPLGGIKQKYKIEENK